MPIIPSSSNTFRNKLSSKMITDKRNPRQDDDIPDPTVVYQIALVAHTKGMSSCPYPMELAKSNCNDFSCDLNNGKKENFVYLCVGKKKLSQLTKEENIINKIIVQVKNPNCGNLKSLSVEVNKVWALGNNLHICYGHDPQFPPLKDVTIHHKISNKMTIPSNCLYELTFDYYLCTFVETNAPKKIEFSNLTIRAEKKHFKLLGKSDIVTELKNNNGSGTSKKTIVRKISHTKYQTSTWNIQNKFSTKVETAYLGQNPIITSFDPNINFNVEFTSSTDMGKMTSSRAVEKMSFECSANAKKYYKCNVTTDKYAANIPYFLDRTIHFYDGKKVTKKITTKFQGVVTSSLKFTRCCIGMACDSTFDYICEGDLKKKSGQCPKLENSLPLFKPTQIFKPDPLKLDAEIDFPVIVDIKMITGRNTFCNTGYEFVKAFNKQDNVRGTDLKYKFETNFSTSHIEYFMCVKKQKLSKIVSYNVINVLKLIKRNDDCGTFLNSEKQKLNEYSEIKICHGYDASRDKFPISEIVFTRESEVKSAISSNFECENVKIGKFRLCYKSAKNATKKISFRNFEYNYEITKKMQMGPPKIIGEVISKAGNKVKTEAKIANRRQSYVNKIIELGSTIDFSAGGAYDKTPVNLSQKIQGKSEDEISQSISYTCDGPEPREFRCYASVFTYRIFVPYTADMVHLDYQGKEIFKAPKKIKGVSDDIITSGIRISKCCFGKNCCTGKETKTGPRKWCMKNKKAIKDILCSKMERCYNEFPLKYKKGQYW